MSELKSQMLIAKNFEFGPPEVIQIVEDQIPVPGKGEILIRSKASTVTVADSRLRSKNVPRGFGFLMSLIFGFKKPKYQSLGTCVAGEVVQAGTNVNSFKVGDRVVGNLGMKLGGHAQYVKIQEQEPIVKIPDQISFEDAAAVVFGGTTALIFLRDKLEIKKGDRLLVIGAGGSVGSAAVQIGKIYGAQVTAVCSTEKVSLIQDLGADFVIDYKKSNWREQTVKFDLILDTVGGTELSNSRDHLSSNGKIGLVIADLWMNLKCLILSAVGSQKMRAGSISEERSDIEQIMTWMTEGKFKAIIGNRFSFEKIVEAHHLVDQGHKFGNTVIIF